MTCDSKLRLDIGCGRMVEKGFIGVDIMPFTDGKGRQVVDVVRDISKHGLPFCDNSASIIKVADVLDHISPSDIVFVMNELWRVLSPEGFMYGSVGLAGTKTHYKDPTHHSFFVEQTFDYFTGTGEVKPERPAHPRYADYGIKPWHKDSVEVDKEIIRFKLIPRK